MFSSSAPVEEQPQAALSKFGPSLLTSRRVGARTAAFSWTAATQGRVQPQDRRAPGSIGGGLQRSSLGQLGHLVPRSRRCRPPMSVCCTRPPGRSRPEGLQVRLPASRALAAPPPHHRTTSPRLAFQPKFCVRPPKPSTLTPLPNAEEASSQWRLFWVQSPLAALLSGSWVSLFLE